MLPNSQQESIFFHFILGNQIFLNNTKPEFFTNVTLKELFEIAKEHVDKYKEAPSKEQIASLIKIKGLSEKLNDDILNAVYNVKTVMDQYDTEWLEQNVGSWIQIRNLDNVMRKAIATVKTSKITADNASEIVEKIRHMLTSETAIDFTFNIGSDFFDPASHLQTKLARTSTGYDYLDLALKGGYWKGALIAFLSGPKAGKSMWLCNLAAKSVLGGYNTAYISFELQEELVTMRIGSNMLDIPIDTYEETAKDQDLIKTKINNLKQNSLKKLGVLNIKEFPSSSASVNDVVTYLKKAEELLGIKFDNIFIDYINIMKNWRNPNSENTYLKIKQISEDLRAAAMVNKWTIITVTQTNRTGWDSSDLTVSSIAESAGLLHTVDVLFGIITSPEMKARGEYFLKCLANRVAKYENTRKRYTIDWKKVRIEEDNKSQIQDMDSFMNNIPQNTQPPKQFGNKSDITTVIPNTITEVDITGNELF